EDPVAAAKRLAAPGMPAGVNDWSCRPSPQKPRPVVLAHGTFTPSAQAWSQLAPALVRRGFCVYALDYGVMEGRPGVAGIGPVAESAEQLATFVEGVRAATNAPKADLVGYSQGGLMPRYYLRFLGGAQKVDRLIGVAPDNHGITLAGLSNLLQTATGPVAGVISALPDLEGLLPGISKLLPRVPALVDEIKKFGNDPLDFLLKGCPACKDQLVGSAFLAKLNAGHETEPGVRYSVLSSRADNVGTPPETQALRGVPQWWVQDRCPLSLASIPAIAHTVMPYDHVVQHRVTQLLDPAPDESTNCFSRA
ncbi:alpha/beta fold hydrolase, partial [Streptomyces sp. T-3]|nr:alpha/beta fold hydrolase [Streptomyces sp. T-3]